MQIRQAESYELLCLAGDGGQGQVFLGIKDNKRYIIKLYFPHKQTFIYYSREVTLLSRLHSNFIVKMIQHFPEGRVTQGNITQVRPMIVLEFVEHGDLFKIVNISRLSQEVSRTLFKQLLKAIRAMKEAQVGHFDIKLENILLDENYNLKLIDFGFAKDLTKQLPFLSQWQGGTTGYIAPEVYEKKYKAYEVDLFAAGVALFLMVFRLPPFQSTNKNNQNYSPIRKGRFEDFWKKYDKRVQVSMPLKRMLTKIFAVDPTVRPSLAQLENEQWLLGPTLNQEELKKYLQPRYHRLQKGDKDTMNIRKVLRQRINKQMEAQKEERQRSRSKQQPKRVLESFREELDTHFSSVQIHEKQFSCFYTSASPKIILLWLHQFLKLQKSEEKPIIDSADTVQFSSFSIENKNQGQIELTIVYCITSGMHSWQSEIKLDGELILWKNKYGLRWTKKKGPDFWASQIKAKLQQEFESMFA